MSRNNHGTGHPLAGNNTMIVFQYWILMKCSLIFYVWPESTAAGWICLSSLTENRDWRDIFIRRVEAVFIHTLHWFRRTLVCEVQFNSLTFMKCYVLLSTENGKTDEIICSTIIVSCCSKEEIKLQRNTWSKQWLLKKACLYPIKI
jgi:hypothetical protein